MIKHFLAFEKQISDLEGKIEELRHLSSGNDINIAEEIKITPITVPDTILAKRHEFASSIERKVLSAADNLI